MLEITCPGSNLFLDHLSEFSNYDEYHSLKIVFLFLITNSVDPDEMSHSVAFHQGLHCLPEYMFSGFQYENSY